MTPRVSAFARPDLILNAGPLSVICVAFSA